MSETRIDFLGFDPAYKTLAYIHMDIMVDILSAMTIIFNKFSHKVLLLGLETSSSKIVFKEEKTLLGARKQCYNIVKEFITVDNILNYFDLINEFNKNLGNLFNNFIRVGVHGVVDVLSGKKVKDVDEITRTQMLKKTLIEAVDAPFAATVGKNLNVVIEHQPPRVGFATNDKSAYVGAQIAYHFAGVSNVYYVSPKLKSNIAFNNIELTDMSGKNKYHARKEYSVKVFLHLIKTLGITITCENAQLNHLADAALGVIAFCKKQKLFK
jgi:hypothetical protein